MIEKDILTILLVGLIIKHFVADFPLQTLWMAKNKGTLLHAGGLAHSGIHAALTLILLACLQASLGVGWLVLLGVVIAEAVVHYFIDYTKMNLDGWLKYSRLIEENGVTTGRLITSGNYYLLLGADQLLHYLTYAAIIYVLL